MKVYELMNELRKGEELEDGLYSNRLKISDIEVEEGIIYTEAP